MVHMREEGAAIAATDNHFLRIARGTTQAILGHVPHSEKPWKYAAGLAISALIWHIRPSSCSNYDAIIIEGSLRDITLSIIFQNRSIP